MQSQLYPNPERITMPRIPELSTEEMNPAQKEIYDDILAGPRSSLRGPFHAWLHSPGLADPAQRLGAFCRFSSSLPKRLSELAIIVVARYWCAQFEWYAHAPMAMEAGIYPDTVEAIRKGTYREAVLETKSPMDVGLCTYQELEKSLNRQRKKLLQNRIKFSQQIN